MYTEAIKMSMLTADEALDLFFMDGFGDLDSGGELDIEVDPEFPLPHHSDSDNSDDDDPSASAAHHPSPSYSDEGDLDKNLGVGECRQIQNSICASNVHEVCTLL